MLSSQNIRKVPEIHDYAIPRDSVLLNVLEAHRLEKNNSHNICEEAKLIIVPV